MPGLLLALVLMAAPVFAQTPVSTLPQYRNAVLEEFGGIHCVYCPEGHQISEAVRAANPGRVVLLNYQAGPYAQPGPGEPDLRSPYGNEIKAQSGLAGYPAATVNRQVFPGWEQGAPGTTAISRNIWANATAQVLQQSSPVNLAAQATLNVATRELSLLVEYYYTANSATPTNRLNVAILQNNILGPQLGGSQGNYYAHQHVVRDLLTGQWGEVIGNTAAGQTGTRTYQVTLPAEYQGVPLDPANVELAIFMAEGPQQILSGISLKPTLQSPYVRDAGLLAVITEPVHCGEALAPRITFRNDGQTPLNSLHITYDLGEGFVAEHNWSGSLPPFATQEITLPPLPVMGEGDLLLEVTLSAPNGYTDENPVNDYLSADFHTAPVSELQELKLDIRTDDFGYEIYWEVLDEAGQIWASGGNLAVGETDGGARVAHPDDEGAYGNNQFVTETIQLPADGCYVLRVLDDFGDGLCCFYGNGFYRLRPTGAGIIIYGNEFGAEDSRPFRVMSEVVATTEPAEAADALLFPNPQRSGQPIWLKLSPRDAQSQQPLHWRLTDFAGRQLAQGVSTPDAEGLFGLDVPALARGGYWVWWKGGEKGMILVE